MGVVDGRKDVEGACLAVSRYARAMDELGISSRIRVGATTATHNPLPFPFSVTINHTNLSVNHWNSLSFHL
jgi:hypothetical protein